MILSESMARYYFKDQNPIGRRISWKLFNGNWSPKAEIVGVAADSRADGIDQTPFHTMYQPDAQTNAQSTLLVRTAGSTDRIAPRVVETIRSLIRTGPIDHVQTLEEIRDETIAPQRLNATLIGLCSRCWRSRSPRWAWRRPRLLGQPAHQRARHPVGARRRAADDPADDPG